MFWKPSYPESVRAVFSWLGGIVREDDAIRLELDGASRFFQFDLPLRGGALPRECSSPEVGKDPSFVIRCGGHVHDAKDGWARLFSSPELSVFERTGRVLGEAPLRWGLTDEDRIAAVGIARLALERFLNSGEIVPREYFDNFSDKFFERTDVDVALWVRGRLRGSAVVENRHFGEGIAEAARIASRDPRFKPLAPEELPETRIEVTLMQGLAVPLAASELRRNVIYPEKGYVLSRSSARGWYLPEVLNVRRFRALEDFLGDLAEEKAGLGRDAWKGSAVRVFEVGDFIESSDRAGIVVLAGPAVRPENGVPRSRVFPRLHAAAAWLCDIQEKDGNLPPVLNPLTGARSQVDWTRLAFTAWTLAEFGAAMRTERYREAAQAAERYLERFAPRLHPLPLAYRSRLALALNHDARARELAELALALMPRAEFDPITFAQVASSCASLAARDNSLLEHARRAAEMVRESFKERRKRGRPLGLALYAELAASYRGMFEITRSDADRDVAHAVADWLSGLQLPDGSFPDSTVSTFAYARGTGKIAEVLALFPERHERTLHRALAWLLSMQYTEESAFFVPEMHKHSALGGFRHDALNHETWIDAAGHLLLLGARLLADQPEA